MGKKNLVRRAVIASLLPLSHAAMAVPVTLTSSIAPNSYLSSGANGGVFDGSSLLPDSFSINSASFSFIFTDDQDQLAQGPAVQTGSTLGAYVLSSSSYNGDYQYTYTRQVNNSYVVQRTGEFESVEVSLGGTGIGSGATTHSTSSLTAAAHGNTTFDGQSGSSGYYYYYGCGNYTCTGYAPGNLSYYYSDQVNTTTYETQDWTGTFGVSGVISDLSILSPLLTDHELLFNLQVMGDLRLVSGVLDLDITPIVSSVPEPAIGLLLLAGLGGMAVVRRRATAGAAM